MGGMEFNKIFAAILVAGIVAMLGGFIARQLIHPHGLEKNAFQIEAAEESAAGGAAAKAGPQPILDLIATADAVRGEKIAKACAACHTFTKGGPNGVGPNLWGVVGGPKDHIPGFAYSGELLKHGGTAWTYAELNKFLYKPKDYAPGTKMTFLGLKKPEDRAALLAWLRTQADAPKALPGDAEIAAEKAELAPSEAVPAAAGGEKASAPAKEISKEIPAPHASVPAKAADTAH